MAEILHAACLIKHHKCTYGKVDKNFPSNGINVLDWPAMSPDLNPIEHLWDELGGRVHSRQSQPQNPKELEMVLLEE